MAHITADRVRDTSTSTSTGNFTVSGTAPTGFRTLSAVLSASDTFYYAIQGQGTSEWEIGLGTYSSTNVFARTTVLSSSNAGSAVNFSAGTKDVFLTLAASKTIQINASGIVDLPASSTINGVAAVTTTGSQTLTNKTLTSPVIGTISNTGTLTLPTSTDTLVGRATTDTLTNKTITSPTITGGTVNNAVIGGTTPAAGTFTTVTDSKGEIRNVPQNAQTSAYTLVASDHGKHISITTGGVTVPSGVFSTGDTVTIYNNSGSNQTITQGASVTLRQVGTANTGNRTLAQYGLCTVLCVASNTFVITGGGIS